MDLYACTRKCEKSICHQNVTGCESKHQHVYLVDGPACGRLVFACHVLQPSDLIGREGLDRTSCDLTRFTTLAEPVI